VAAACLGARDTVIEIGAGLGFLTERLARTCEKVIAVEKDRLFCSYLRERFRNEPRVAVEEADILLYPFGEQDTTAVIAVVGNIPYQLTSPLLEVLIANRAFLGSVVITIQKDVALRLTAKPGSRCRSALSCWMEMHARIEKIRDFAKGVFYPPPGVDSSLVRIHFFKNPRYKEGQDTVLRGLVRSAFQKKRKTLINALSGRPGDLPKDVIRRVLLDARIPSHLRPEDLGTEQWLSLAAILGRDF